MGIKKVRIVLAGQWRGNDGTWNCIKEFKNYHNAEVYVASHERWNLPFEYNFAESPEIIKNTKFDLHNHPHTHRYLLQLSGLYNCWNAWNSEWNTGDIIVKLRNDLEFPIFELNPIPNTFHVPAKEFHAEPFPQNILCNDQIGYGYKDVMDTYFSLPYTFDWDYPRKKEGIEFLGGSYNIEEILRNHLYANNIDLKTFDIIYNKK